MVSLRQFVHQRREGAGELVALVYQFAEEHEPDAQAVAPGVGVLHEEAPALERGDDTRNAGFAHVQLARQLGNAALLLVNEAVEEPDGVVNGLGKLAFAPGGHTITPWIE